MNVCIMYVKISAVYCMNHAEKQVEYQGKVMNILMLQQLIYIYIYTRCGRKLMRLATLCTNRQCCCISLHMTVRLTPAVDSVQV